MKIAVIDPDSFTFSQQLIDHWESQGHEVVKSIYYEPEFMNADVVFFDYASMRLTEYVETGIRAKKCIVRSIDVENYMGYFDGFNNSDMIDHFIFLNESQRELLCEKGFKLPNNNIHIIPPGINMDNYQFRVKPIGNPVKLVYVGRLWIGKNVLGAIEVAYLWSKMGKNVELHIRGDRLDPNWWRKQIEYTISKMNFPIYIDDRVESMDEYLNDKDYMIVPSFKEAFSYVAAEAMAKGIPVAIRDWYGSSDVWPEDLIYQTPNEAIKIFKTTKNTNNLRSFINDKYNENIMFERIDALL